MFKSLKRAFLFCGIILGGGLLLASGTTVGFVLSLKEKPRSAAFLIPYISNLLSHTIGPNTISAKTSLFEWNEASKSIVLNIQNAKIAGTANNIAEVEQLKIEATLSNLIAAGSPLTLLKIEGLQIFNYASAEDNIPHNEGDDFSSIAQWLKLFENSEIELNRIAVMDNGNPVLQIDDFSALKRDGYIGGTGVLSSYAANYNQPSRIFFGFANYIKNKRYDFSAEFDRFNPSLLSGLKSLPQELAGIKIPINGSATLSGIFGGLTGSRVDMVKYNIKTDPGTLELPEVFLKRMKIREIDAQGKIIKNLKVFDAEKIIVKLTGTEITYGGRIERRPSKINPLSADKIYMDCRFSLTNLNMNYLDNYWPLVLAPDTRKWVTNAFSGGIVSDASVDLKLEDNHLYIENSHEMPVNSVKAIINVAGTNLKYSPTLKPIENIAGTINFSAAKMTADVNSAASGGLQISNGKVEIGDLRYTGSVLNVSADFSGNMEQAFAYANAEPISLSKKISLSDNPVLDGAVSGKVQVREELSGNAPTEIELTSSVRNGKIGEIMNGFTVSDLESQLEIAKNQFSMKGTSRINGIPANLSVVVPNINQVGHSVTLNGTASDSEIQKATDIIDVTNGTADYELRLEQSGVTTEAGGDSANNSGNFTLTANLENLLFTSDGMGFEKLEKTPLIFGAKGVINADAITINDLNLAGENTQINLNGALDSSGKIRALNIVNAKYGRNNFAGSIADDGTKINLNATTIDLAPHISSDKDDDKDGEGDTKDDDPTPETPLFLDLKATKAYGVGGVELNNLVLNMQCAKSSEDCESLNLSAAHNGGEVSEVNLTEGVGGGISVKSGNAGEFLKGFDLFESIGGGVLEVSGSHSNASNPNILEGKMMMTDFKLIDAPVMAKLLSIASITGIADLNSGGISFSRMKSTFTVENKVIRFKGMRCSGPSLGLTASGKVDRNTDIVKIKGTVIPAYTLNTLVSKTPLIGALLAGGEGEGVFAANFSMEGDSDDPSIGVNPLSIATPGFLRKIFSVFDVPEDEQTEIESKIALPDKSRGE